MIVLVVTRTAMASSTYYTNSESSYWPYQFSEPRTYDQSSYHPGTYHQMPQQPQQSSPYVIKPSHQHSPSSSLLETLLRHGKEAVSQNYTSVSTKNVPSIEEQTSRSQLPCQTSPYTPSSSSDRTSPLAGLLGDAASQDQYQNSSYQTYQKFNQNGMMSLNSAFEATQAGYSYGNNNNNGKRSPNEMSDYGDEVRQDYLWMKSSLTNGT